MAKKEFGSKQAEPAAPPAEKIPRKSKLALALVGFGGLLTFAVGLVLAAYAYVNYQYNKDRNAPEQAMVFEVERGSGLSKVADQLEAGGLIDSAFIFKLVTKMNGGETSLKAGEFSLAKNMSMADIFTELSEGTPILYPVTFPEGRTSAQIVRILNDAPHLTGEITEIPAEGTLLPETYLYQKGRSRQSIIDEMKQAQTSYIDSLWENRDPDLPIKTKEDAIILASIVEKETGIGGERPEVASVFINRLNRGMRLESDPTIIYGITGGEPLGRRIFRSEINRKTDWNTYQMDGLPKTAICNPGKEAIAAVLNPPTTDYLFFVADGSGGHAFSRTYAEHRRNVAEWMKIRDVVNPK